MAVILDAATFVSTQAHSGESGTLQRKHVIPRLAQRAEGPLRRWNATAKYRGPTSQWDALHRLRPEIADERSLGALRQPRDDSARRLLYRARSDELPRQTRTPPRLHRHPRPRPRHRYPQRSRFHPRLPKQRLRLLSRARHGTHSGRRGLETHYLHFRSANVASAPGAYRPLVSLVHRRRPRARLGAVSAHPLFFGRNAWHDRGRDPLKQPVLEPDAVHDSFLRLRPFLSGRNHLCLLYPAAKDQMDRVGLRGVSSYRLCHPIQFISSRPHRRAQQLPHLFWAGDDSASPAAQGGHRAPEAFRSPIPE